MPFGSPAKGNCKQALTQEVVCEEAVGVCVWGGGASSVHAHLVTWVVVLMPVLKLDASHEPKRVLADVSKRAELCALVK